MVKFRGISVSMISQHDIRKLPEYEPPASAGAFHTDGLPLRSEDKASITCCFVPSYPGSQIWFDYSIENPHPPNAQYFFKLLRNGEVFASWDCTAEHNYKGRTTYALKYLGTHPQTGQPVIERRAFRFSTEPLSHNGPSDNVVEVRVHRVEHRRRLPLDDAKVKADDVLAGVNICHDGLRLVSGGILAPNDPKRIYKYQLLDPVDKPYATIRFYYRPLESLMADGIVASSSNHSRHTSIASTMSRTSSDFPSSVSRSASEGSSACSPARSVNSTATGSSRRGCVPTDSVAAWLHHHRLQKYTASLGSLSFDKLVTLSDSDLASLGVAAKGARTKLLREFDTYKQHHLQHLEQTEHVNPKANSSDSVHPAPEASPFSPSAFAGSREAFKSENRGYCIGHPEIDASVCVVAKDDMDITAVRVPPPLSTKQQLSAPGQKASFCPAGSPSEAAGSAPAEKVTFSTEEIKPSSRPKSPKRPRKSLKVQINGAEFELEKETKRPLSPFTSGGMLRRLLSAAPTSAPAQVTAFGPSIEDEAREMLAEMECGHKGKMCLRRTTRAERGGAMMRKILGKRMGRA